MAMAYGAPSIQGMMTKHNKGIQWLRCLFHASAFWNYFAVQLFILMQELIWTSEPLLTTEVLQCEAVSFLYLFFTVWAFGVKAPE